MIKILMERNELEILSLSKTPPFLCCSWDCCKIDDFKTG